MGFKRTSEGRVFFTGADVSPSNDTPLSSRLSERPEVPKSSGLTSDHSSQLQMLSLLKSLNEKLNFMNIERKSMRQEIESYRQLVRSLEAKSEVTRKDLRGLKEAVKSQPATGQSVEKVRADFLAQMEDARALISKLEGRTERVDRSMEGLLGQADKHKQVTVALSRQQSELNRRYAALMQQVEEGAIDYEELVARMEGMNKKQSLIETRIEEEQKDRKRFMRQIERIEHHVASISQEQLQIPRRENDVIAEQGEGAHKPVFISSASETHKYHQSFSARARKFAETFLDTSVLKGGAIFVVACLIGYGSWKIVPELAAQNTAIELPVSEYVSPAPQTSGWEQTQDISAFSGLHEDASRVNDLTEPMVDMSALAPAMNAIEPGVNEVVAGNIPKPNTADILPAAVQELLQMAENGNASAQHDLAAFYIVGAEGVSKDYQKAAYWFDKAAQNGVSNAAYNLGVLYHQGLGVEQDLQKALQWYGIAASDNHAEAQYNLGIAAIEGVGTKYNPAEATLHFEKAAQNGVVEAAYNLGLIYENGLLGSPNPAEALMWYKAAADAGNKEALAALNQLAGSLGVSLDDIKRAVPEGDVIGSLPLDANQLAQNQAVQTARSAPVYDNSLVRSVQEYLAVSGFYSGVVDGQYGPATRAAIEAYQADQSLAVNGVPSAQLLARLRG